MGNIYIVFAVVDYGIMQFCLHHRMLNTIRRLVFPQCYSVGFFPTELLFSVFSFSCSKIACVWEVF